MTQTLETEPQAEAGVLVKLSPSQMSTRLLDKVLDNPNHKAEELSRVVDLHEKLVAIRAKELYALAMAACQREMPVVVKDATNPSTKSKYAKLETVHKAIKPVYLRHGFSISWGMGEGGPEGHIRLLADVHHEGGMSKQYTFDIPKDGLGPKGQPLAMNAPQAAGSTMSYGRRYGECLIFDITIADEDDDAQGGPDKVVTHAQAMELTTLIKACDEENLTNDILDWVGEQMKLPEGKRLETVEEIPLSYFELVRRRLADKLRKKGGAK